MMSATVQSTDSVGPHETLGDRMHALAARLYPICRSITGNGVRQSLRILSEMIPLELHEVPSGTSVFDWTVPREWNIRDAYVANARGERVIDFRRHNLHVVQYSAPVRARMTLDDLRSRLFSIPERPNSIPYRTSYYKETWGFCLTDTQLRALQPGEYEVVIDASLTDGSLTYGELFLAGETDEEVLFHAHCCHPSLANDNLSGLVVAAFLADTLAKTDRRYSYRFLFLPGTVGPITWLARNEHRVSRIRHGLVLSGIGDAGSFTYKRSRRSDAPIDRAMQHLLTSVAGTAQICDFDPYGYDERQVPFSGIQSSRWLFDAHTARNIPRVPHVGRQPRFSTTRQPRRVPATVGRSRPSPRTRSTMRESVAEGRATTGEARVVSFHRRNGRRCSTHGAALGAELV